MYVAGADYLQFLMTKKSFSAKMVFNENGAVIFPVDSQHSKTKGPGISYEDGYAGNALAAMLAPGRIEIRYHQDFPEARVVSIVKKLVATPELSFTDGWEVMYQARKLVVVLEKSPS
ncbi:MAG: hypothetical protein C0404_12730 [Verrucomicrobia bacterium]|nr:hypothetical protein [Verrucomicrobiota bacterium]